MMDVLKTYLRTQGNLSEAEIERVLAMAAARLLQRNEALLQQGEVCRYKNFVAKGLLRIYGIAADGSEHILQFSPELTWTVDAESYDHQLPSKYNITSVERSEVLQWTKADFDQLVAEIPALKTFSQQLVSRNNYNSRQRLLTALSATPEEKYKEFIQTHSGLLGRLPLHMIASYLGISLKTLTRIRHTQLHR